MSIHSEKVPKTMVGTFAAVTALTDAFCRERLDAEYAQMMRFVAAALARKRPSPLASGTPATWAAGIAHAVGSINFLFDPAQRPHLTAGNLYAAFGVAQGTGQGRSKKVRDLLGMSQFDPRWALPSRLHDHPTAWLVETGTGFILDARSLPRDQQVLLHRAGLIPGEIGDAPPFTCRAWRPEWSLPEGGEQTIRGAGRQGFRSHTSV